MDRLPYGPYERQWPGDGQPIMLFVLAGALVIGGGLLAGVLFKPFSWQENAAPAPSRVSELVYPATLDMELARPANEAWLLPTAAASLGGLTFVLDTGNSRVLGLDSAGTATYDSSAAASLDQPMAIVTDGSRLFVADSLAGQVLVLDPAGGLRRRSVFPASREPEGPPALSASPSPPMDASSFRTPPITACSFSTGRATC